jgi:hypothetical protein
MAYILYYSTFCIQCQKLLQYISKNPVKNKIHFICIDARTVDSAGNLIIHLENGGPDLVIPPNITRVPALIQIQKNNRVLFGFEDIRRMFEDAAMGGIVASAAPPAVAAAAAAAAVEPRPYVLNSCVGCGSSGFGVTSDNYSYYDMTAEELKTTGTGGLRQMHNYVSIKQPFDTKIYTPSDDYVADKISSEITVEKLQQQRNAEIGGGVAVSPAIPQELMSVKY